MHIPYEKMNNVINNADYLHNNKLKKRNLIK